MVVIKGKGWENGVEQESLKMLPNRCYKGISSYMKRVLERSYIMAGSIKRFCWF